jgi:hypothetical protein
MVKFKPLRSDRVRGLLFNGQSDEDRSGIRDAATSAGGIAIRVPFKIPAKQRPKAVREVVRVTSDHRFDFAQGMKLAREDLVRIERGWFVRCSAIQAAVFERRFGSVGREDAEKFDIRLEAEFFFKFSTCGACVVFAGTQMSRCRRGVLQRGFIFGSRAAVNQQFAAGVEHEDMDRPMQPVIRMDDRSRGLIEDSILLIDDIE